MKSTHSTGTYRNTPEENIKLFKRLQRSWDKKVRKFQTRKKPNEPARPKDPPYMAENLAYRKDYFFNGVKREFEAEITVYTQRVLTALAQKIVYLGQCSDKEHWLSYPTLDVDRESAHLKKIASDYINGMARNRENLTGAGEVMEKIYKQLLGIEHRIAWTPLDFLVQTPIRLEEITLLRLRKEVKELDQEIEEARLAGSDWEKDGKKRRIAKERYQRLADRRHQFTWSSFDDCPSTIITATYERLVFLQEKSGAHRFIAAEGYDTDTYLQSYTYFQDQLSKLPPRYFEGKDLVRIQSFIRQFTRRAGDIEAQGRLLKRCLDYKTVGNTREFYIDPFYPKSQDFETITFPSAQADFVAARVIACAGD